jgi:hypothetical protein
VTTFALLPETFPAGHDKAHVEFAAGGVPFGHGVVDRDLHAALLALLMPGAAVREEWRVAIYKADGEEWGRTTGDEASQRHYFAGLEGEPPIAGWHAKLMRRVVRTSDAGMFVGNWVTVDACGDVPAEVTV